MISTNGRNCTTLGGIPPGSATASAELHGAVWAILNAKIDANTRSFYRAPGPRNQRTAALNQHNLYRGRPLWMAVRPCSFWGPGCRSGRGRRAIAQLPAASCDLSLAALTANAPHLRLDAHVRWPRGRKGYLTQ